RHYNAGRTRTPKPVTMQTSGTARPDRCIFGAMQMWGWSERSRCKAKARHARSGGALLRWVAALALLLCILPRTMAQCPLEDNILIPDSLLQDGQVLPACPGTTNIPCIFSGQYAMVQVEAGNVYTFYTSFPTGAWDTALTPWSSTTTERGICAGLEGPFRGAGRAQIIWTATYTGLVYIVLTEGPGCGLVSDPNNPPPCATLAVSCAAPITNDQCSGAITVGDGLTPFSTIGATATGGDLTPNSCSSPSGANGDTEDVWFVYTATCTGTVTVSTCGILNDN